MKQLREGCARAVVAAFLWQMSAVAFADPVITTVPEKPMEYRTATGRTLNFDFRIANPDTTPLELSEIRLLVSDEAGAVLSDLIINQNGISPSMLTIPSRTVAPGASITVFNPYPLVPAGITGPVTLRYEWKFAAGEDKVVTASTTVAPIAYTNRTRLRFPLEGRTLIWDGHDFYSHHRRLDFDHAIVRELKVSHNTARYAYDFTLVDEKGRRFKGDGPNKQDHFSYGAPVHATADGAVAFVHDGMPEDQEVGLDEIRKETLTLYGNSVVIDHGNGEFSRFGHLQTGSVAVKVGDRVKAGQVIGRVGNSGASLFPHLHYELVTGVPFDSEGLPSAFVDLYRVLGKKRVKLAASPDTGDIIEKGR